MNSLPRCTIKMIKWNYYHVGRMETKVVMVVILPLALDMLKAERKLCNALSCKPYIQREFYLQIGICSSQISYDKNDSVDQSKYNNTQKLIQ